MLSIYTAKKEEKISDEIIIGLRTLHAGVTSELPHQAWQEALWPLDCQQGLSVDLINHRYSSLKHVTLPQMLGIIGHKTCMKKVINPRRSRISCLTTGNVCFCLGETPSIESMTLSTKDASVHKGREPFKRSHLAIFPSLYS